MLKKVCDFYLKKKGWKIQVDLPADLRSFVFLGAPHTSNEDFLPAMAIVNCMDRHARFVIKDSWMRFPFNLVLGPAGALGINRENLKEKKGSTTDVMAALFKQFPELVLMIAPEGTRSANGEWKTGFYYIAQKAQVPIVLGYADFDRKVAGTGPVIYPTDFEKDMRTIMNFYKDIHGRKPANFKLDNRFLDS
ncbi:MAG: 1-acyl-sn-glycerol-3-phosphate acyltransferase [Bacteriovoracia bacterium]